MTFASIILIIVLTLNILKDLVRYLDHSSLEQGIIFRLFYLRSDKQGARRDAVPALIIWDNNLLHFVGEAS